MLPSDTGGQLMDEEKKKKKIIFFPFWHKMKVNIISFHIRCNQYTFLMAFISFLMRSIRLFLSTQQSEVKNIKTKNQETYQICTGKRETWNGQTWQNE